MPRRVDWTENVFTYEPPPGNALAEPEAMPAPIESNTLMGGVPVNGGAVPVAPVTPSMAPDRPDMANIEWDMPEQARPFQLRSKALGNWPPSALPESQPYSQPEADLPPSEAIPEPAPTTAMPDKYAALYPQFALADSFSQSASSPDEAIRWKAYKDMLRKSFDESVTQALDVARTAEQPRIEEWEQTRTESPTFMPGAGTYVPGMAYEESKKPENWANLARGAGETALDMATEATMYPALQRATETAASGKMGWPEAATAAGDIALSLPTGIDDIAVAAMKGGKALLSHADNVLLSAPALGAAAIVGKAQPKAPVFFSQLEKTVGDKLPNTGFSGDYLKAVDSWANKGEFKREEVEWTGLKEWLEGRKGRVPKQEVLDYLQANKIEVQEVWKGFGPKDAKRLDELDNRIRGGQSLSVEERREYDYLTGQESFPATQGTKFSQYTTPGGENYREVVLTLPVGPRQNEIEIIKLSEQIGDIQRQRRAIQEKINYDTPHRWTAEDRANVRKVNELHEQEATLHNNLVKLDMGPNRKYTSSHWDEPNPIAHVRYDDRTGPNGEKIMHIAEIQSDWHQEGRKKGYQTKERDLTNLVATRMDDGYWEVRNGNGEFITNVIADSKGINPKTAEEAIVEAQRRIREDPQYSIAPREGVPDAPFKTTWPLLSMKRMIREASEKGYDGISWDTGLMQAERYDLSKQVDSINYRVDGKDTFEVSAIKDGESVLQEHGKTPAQLEELVGKELAQKIINGDGVAQKGGGNVKQLSGLDLKVGGEGMKSFYDKMLPNEINKYVKKWGGRVQETHLATATTPYKGYVDYEVGLSAIGNPAILGINEYGERTTLAQFESQAKAEAKLNEMKSGATVPYLAITPSMKQTVLEKGQPLFNLAPLGAAGAAYGLYEATKPDPQNTEWEQ